MPRLTQEQKSKILKLHECGYTYVDIAKEVGCSQQTVWKTVKHISKPLGADETDETVKTDNSDEKQEEPTPPQESGKSWMSSYSPMYKRIKELMKQKIAIDEELRSIRATLRKGINIIDGMEEEDET